MRVGDLGSGDTSKVNSTGEEWAHGCGERRDGIRVRENPHSGGFFVHSTQPVVMRPATCWQCRTAAHEVSVRPQYLGLGNGPRWILHVLQ